MPFTVRSARRWANVGAGDAFAGAADAVKTAGDGSRAVATGAGALGCHLRAFDFDLPAAGGATLGDITATVRRSAAGATVSDSAVYLTTALGSRTVSRADPAPWSDGADTEVSYTFRQSDWVAPTVEPRIDGTVVSQTGFSVHVEAASTAAGDAARIDQVRLKVAWTAGAVKECFYPASTWVHKVCWVPPGLGQGGVQVTFKSPTLGPYFTCRYPFTTHDDYDVFLVMASKGRWVLQFYWWLYYEPVPLEI